MIKLLLNSNLYFNVMSTILFARRLGKLADNYLYKARQKQCLLLFF